MENVYITLQYTATYVLLFPNFINTSSVQSQSCKTCAILKYLIGVRHGASSPLRACL